MEAYHGITIGSGGVILLTPGTAPPAAGYAIEFGSGSVLTWGAPFVMRDLSGLPTSDPGSGRPWRDATTGAVIVGALGSFGISQGYVDTGLSTKVNKSGDTMTGLLTANAGVKLGGPTGSSILNYLSGSGVYVQNAFGGNGTVSAGAGIFTETLTTGQGLFTPQVLNDNVVNALKLRSELGVSIRNNADNGFSPLTTGSTAVGGARLGSGTLEVQGNGINNVQEWKSPAYNMVTFVSVMPSGLGMNIGGVYVGHPNDIPANLPAAFTILNGGIWFRTDTQVIFSDGAGAPKPFLLGTTGPSIRTDGTAVQFKNSGGTANAPVTSGQLSVTREAAAVGFAIDVITANASDGGLRLRPENLSQQVKMDWHEIRANGTYMIGTQGGPLRLFTAGTLRWDIDGSGNLIPFVNGVHEIGSQFGNKPAVIWVNDIVSAGSRVWSGGGSASSPSFAFNGGGDTGMSCPTYWNVNNRTLVFSTGGVTAMTLADSAGGRAATFVGALYLGPVTFGTLGSASAQAGARYRITDRGQRECYSDGTNWRFAADDAIVT